MRRQRTSWLWPACASGLASIAWLATPHPTARAFGQASLAEQSARAVVQLLAIGPGANGNDRKCSGTGFFINEEGIVLTNAHVIHEAERCVGAGAQSRGRGMLAKLPTETGNAAPAIWCEVIGLDDVHDLGILRPERPLHGREAGSPCPFLSLDVSGAQRLEQGAPIWVTGHPLFAWQPVSQTGEFARPDRLRLSGPQGELVDVLILDITLHPGSSGSPVFAREGGGVIGVVEGQASRRPSETIALPIRYAVDLLNRYSLHWRPAPK